MGQSFPSVTSNIYSAKSTISNDERSILLVGAMVSGSASSGELIENLISESDFNNYFGRTSQLAKAGRSMLKASEISRIKPKISAIGLVDNGSGVASTGSFAFSGTATANGTLNIYIDSKINGKYTLNIISGQTASQIGDALVSLIGANLDSPVTSSNSTGTVTITAVNKGTQGNTIGLKLDGSVDGISCTITAMSSGATDPSLTGLFDVIADKRYTTIVYPTEWGTSTLTALTEARFNVDNKIIDGVGIVSKTATYANSNSALDSLNYKTLNYIPNKLISGSKHKGGAIFESPIVIASYCAIYRELRLTKGANTSSITVNGQGVGGTFFASIPYHNTPFALLPTIETGNDFSDAEALELENSGGWLLRNNPANTLIISNSAVTTYKTNALSQIDKTFKYLNYVDTLTSVREFFFNNIKSDFAGCILTTGQLVAGRPMVNKEIFITTLCGYYNTLSGINGDNNYVLLRASREDALAFKKALNDSTQLNLIDGQITTEAIANIVTQLRSIIINFTPTFE